ncbi:hypothetical protein ACHAQH_002734 [Verticillium albo-atrum]
MATTATTTLSHVTMTGASASATPTVDPAPSEEKRAPIWISIFILFGALTGLVLLFLAICFVARRVMIPGFSPTRANTPDPEAHAHTHGTGPAPPRTPAAAIPAVSIEAMAKKIEQLDKSAPVMTYKAWQVEVEGEEEEVAKGEEVAKEGARASSYLVCVICLETLEDSDVIRHLPCRHIYHSECITQWFLKKHDTCPLCKVNYMPQVDGEAGRDGEIGVARPPAAFRREGPHDAMYRLYTQVPI